VVGQQPQELLALMGRKVAAPCQQRVQALPCGGNGTLAGLTVVGCQRQFEAGLTHGEQMRAEVAAINR